LRVFKQSLKEILLKGCQWIYCLDHPIRKYGTPIHTWGKIVVAIILSSQLKIRIFSIILEEKAMKYRLITLLSASAFLALLGGVMFLIAGTFSLPSIWLYLGLRLLFSLACVMAMSEDVARERMKPGPGSRRELIYITGTTIAWVEHIVLASLDLGRFRWSRSFPALLQAAGVVVMLAAFALAIWALMHNEYMSARLRIQGDRGQHVIDTGPYAIIRHPNYAAGFLISLTNGLVLGSWVAVLPLLVHMGLLMYRTIQEEKMLVAELEGYADYSRRVHWRFLPGVW